MTWTLANVTNAYLHQCVPLGLDFLENGSRRPQYEELKAIGDCFCLTQPDSRDNGCTDPRYGRWASAVFVYCWLLVDCK